MVKECLDSGKEVREEVIKKGRARWKHKKLGDAESNLCVAGSNGPVKECEAHVFIGT